MKSYFYLWLLFLIHHTLPCNDIVSFFLFIILFFDAQYVTLTYCSKAVIRINVNHVCNCLFNVIVNRLASMNFDLILMVFDRHKFRCDINFFILFCFSFAKPFHIINKRFVFFCFFFRLLSYFVCPISILSAKICDAKMTCVNHRMRCFVVVAAWNVNMIIQFVILYPNDKHIFPAHWHFPTNMIM